MKVSYLCSLGVFVGVALIMGVALPGSAYVTSFPDEPDIDGILITVGITVAEWLAGLIPYPGVSALVIAIIEAWRPKPEDDYWENVEDQVKEVCGSYINQENIDRVVIYKDSLVDLLDKYNNAPVQSDGSYPDKNILADSITTSVMSQRYLLEASEKPWSMTLHFVDIASAHILILKDVAESYSTDTDVSLWWRDLATQLSHYTAYSKKLYTETVQWRQQNVECYTDAASQACIDFEWAGTVCYDKIEVRDHVINSVDSCTQLHPEGGDKGSCSQVCDLYEKNMVRTFTNWYRDHVQVAVDQWVSLRVLAEKKASQASRFHNPLKRV